MESELEHILTNTYKAEMIKFMKSHPECFNELINLSVSDSQKYSWRASWLLWSCIEPNDNRLNKYLNKIVDVLPIKKDNQQRELLIVLQKMEIDSSLEGKIIDACINIWEKKGKNVSLRYNALKLLIKISQKYPELSREIRLLTEPQYVDELSDTAKKSIYRLTNELR